MLTSWFLVQCALFKIDFPELEKQMVYTGVAIKCVSGVDLPLPAEPRTTGPSQSVAAAPRQQRLRPANSRDERFRSGRDRGTALRSDAESSVLFSFLEMSAEEIIFTGMVIYYITVFLRKSSAFTQHSVC